MMCVMHVDFCCPRCERTTRTEFSTDSTAITCPHCDAKLSWPSDAIENDTVNKCVVCHGKDLFVRKDFPQRLGVLIVAIGFTASSVAWYYHLIVLTYGILFATAGIDVLLYLWMGEALVCYHCGAHYRNINNLDGHAAFNLEAHERYRQAAARQ